ncbi:hypothetical protein PVK06_024193 [Gossypium arboreum]|uniref:Reverse transcriptase n=1 Tax=Gossypium arboreum TaxID=29729 RepID=A0ABR0PDI9_GOSAR|nr:hypothetical protein PVK06_024193 [Gossypium arboreum]
MRQLWKIYSFGKSTVFFSSNIQEKDKTTISRILGVRSSNNPERYLGLPNMADRRKKMAFQILKDRIKERIDSCSVKHLSQCEKEKNRDKKGIHWCTWKDLCSLKEDGVLGFRNLDKFNVVLLAKQGWRLINFPNSLLSRVLKAKYYPSTDFFNAQLGNLPSLTWKSVWVAKGILEKGLCWRVGTGDRISVWGDLWISRAEIEGLQNKTSNENIRQYQI